MKVYFSVCDANYDVSGKVEVPISVDKPLTPWDVKTLLEDAISKMGPGGNKNAAS
jgi:hypothetical protein